MKINTTIIIFLIGILFLGCDKDDKSGFSVSGKLQTNGMPAANVIVTIDGLMQYKTTTDSEGKFLINNISAGDHSIDAKRSYDSGGYIQKSFDIDVNGDLNLDNLLLPNPVSISSIQLDSATNMATIIWNKSFAEDFREYKLYSHNTSGLDENTGTLVHVATDANDTIKTVHIDNSSNMYFRVFVMNEYGLLGGSNIVNVQSENINLAKGGAFDNSDDLDSWDITGDVEIDNSTYHNGTGSLYLHSTIDTNSTSGGFPVSTNEISSIIDLESNRDYTLSFWYRVTGYGYMMEPIKYYYIQNNDYKISTSLNGSECGGDTSPVGPFEILNTVWLYYSADFTSDSEDIANFHLTTTIENVWIDDLQIKIVE